MFSVQHGILKAQTPHGAANFEVLKILYVVVDVLVDFIRVRHQVERLQEGILVENAAEHCEDRLSLSLFVA